MTIIDRLNFTLNRIGIGGMPRRAQILPSFISKQVAEARRFYLGPTVKVTSGPIVVCGGWERTEPDYRIKRPGLRYYAMEFVASGRGTLHLGEQDFPLSRGTVFTYGPGIAHEITNDSSDRLSKYFVDFSGAGARAAMAAAGVAPGNCCSVADPAEVQAAFERLLESGQRGTPTAARITNLHAQILLLVVSGVRLPSGEHGERSRQTFLRCRDFLEKNYASIRTAEEIATACRVGPAYLSRLFRRFAGQPAYRFLMRLKMNEAAALLERQVMNVSETAEALGMDPFHFSRAFKRVHGRPPAYFLARGRLRVGNNAILPRRYSVRGHFSRGPRKDGR